MKYLLIFSIVVSNIVFAESSLYQRGKDYYYGTIVTGKDYEKAKAAFEHAAKLGDLDAINALGFLYINGKGVEINDAKGIEYLTKAAEKGHAKSQYDLGSMYYLGVGVKRNINSAFKWIKLSAEGGYTDAEYNLANMYENGHGVKTNLVLANEWYAKSAKSENKNSQFYIAKKHLENKDFDSAYKMFKSSGENGHVEAQYYLAEMYKKGQGVVQSYDDAIIWYKKSAKGGNVDSLGALGLMYNLGLGVDKDHIKAEYYFNEFNKLK